MKKHGDTNVSGPTWWYLLDWAWLVRARRRREESRHTWTVSPSVTTHPQRPQSHHHHHQSHHHQHYHLPQVVCTCTLTHFYYLFGRRKQSCIKFIKLKKSSDDLTPAQSWKLLSPLHHSVEREELWAVSLSQIRKFIPKQANMWQERLQWGSIFDIFACFSLIY